MGNQKTKDNKPDKDETEKLFHWADQIALEVKERVEKSPILQKIVKEKGYIVYDEKTPSGKIHIGSGRGWIIHDVIAKALRNIGLKGKFVLSSDDIDPFDKLNSSLDKSYEKYLGMPFRDIPSPVEGYKSFAEYYFMQCVEKFEEFGIEAEIHSTGEQYDKGTFNAAIKTALDNADKIQEIYVELYGEDAQGANRLPFNPICEKCGKIGTTNAFEWNKKTEMLKYRCEENLVEWAKGCGHEGEISPYNGNGKFPWKVEWAAKWPSIGVVAETAGKDHFTQGGSRTAAIAIASRVFEFPPPWPSTEKYTGKGYEFFLVGGKKMSTSKGQGIGFADITNYAPANIVRYLLVKTRPHAMIDFEPASKNDLILLYDRYDKTERIYYDKEETSNDDEKKKQKRIYELSYIGEIKKEMPLQIAFSHCSVIIQAASFDIDKSTELLKKTGHIDDNTSDENLAYVKDRLSFAGKWIQEFADEQYKFEVVDAVSAENLNKLDDTQKKAIAMLHASLKKDWNEQALFEEFYRICEETGIDNKEFFKTIYTILINKERGPKLAGFILTIGKERVAEILAPLSQADI